MVVPILGIMGTIIETGIELGDGAIINFGQCRNRSYASLFVFLLNIVMIFLARLV